MSEPRAAHDRVPDAVRYDRASVEYGRLVNLSDAVFAIAMTLLVLGFALVSSIWWHHHRLMARLAYADRGAAGGGRRRRRVGGRGARRARRQQPGGDGAGPPGTEDYRDWS